MNARFLLLVFSLIVICIFGDAPAADGGVSVDLAAGRKQVAVGVVKAEVEDGLLRVTYETESSWLIRETHIHVADTAEGIPQTKSGNPIPGRFTHQTDHSSPTWEVTYVINLADEGLGETRFLYIAAHAELTDGYDPDVEESAWAKGSDFSGKNWATYFVFKVNRPPVAVDDHVVVYAGQTVTFNVLANDSDPDGDTLSASVQDEPSYGDLDLQTNGSASYTPDARVLGTDTFSYIASDEDGLQDTGHVTLEIRLVPEPWDNLRYNEVSMKASHNTYQRDEPMLDQLTWHHANPWNCGCGALELDISQSDDGERWSVGHDRRYVQDSDKQLHQFLHKLTNWSDSSFGHDVITLHLDLKKVTGGAVFPAQLDQYIRGNLAADVYTPEGLMGSAGNLSDGAKANGWPRLGDLRGKFIICVTGNAADKAAYAITGPRERLCFADKDMDADEAPHDPNRVFFNYHIYHADREKWKPVFHAAATRPEVIIRAYVANSDVNWVNCLSSGCNLIATDKIRNHDWAYVGDDGRFVELVPLR